MADLHELTPAAPIVPYEWLYTRVARHNDFVDVHERHGAGMAKSLQDQLLEAGALKKDRATKLKKAKHKEAKQRLRGSAQPDEVKVTARRAQAEKAERDRRLSRERQAELDKNALAAQVRQLIDMNRVVNADGDIPYNFTDRSVIKTIDVTTEHTAALAGGRLAIARLDSSYVLIRAAAATKIMERDADAIVVLNTADNGKPAADDPYAEFEIPDDLTW